MLSLDFDLIIILVLLAFVLIGYVTGATVEFIKLLKLIIPFLIVFYFGGFIARLVFKSSLFNSLINNVSYLKGMAYFNTLVMFVSTFIAFFGSYFIISLLIRYIQKKIQSENVTFKLGKINHSLGALLAVVRFYILASLMLLPFYLFNITTKDNDFLTKIIIENPPVFTRVGHMVNSTEPVINATNALTNFMDVVDLNKIQGYYSMLTSLPEKLGGYDDEIEKAYLRIRLEDLSFSVSATGEYPYLVDFLNDPDRYINATSAPELKGELLEKKISYGHYKGLLLWVINNNIETLNNDQLIATYHADYEMIQANTNNAELKADLEKTYQGTQIYLTIENWLSILEIDTDNLANLLDDNNIKKILERLVYDIANKETEGLIFDLNQFNYESLDQKLVSIEKFVKNYHEIYRPIMEKMTVNLPFKYKLIAATLTKVNFIDSLKRSPLMAMYVIDSIEFIGQSIQITDENTYHSLIKIIIPVYIIIPDEQGNVKTYTASDMNEFLVGIDQGLKDVILTEKFVITLLEALTEAKYDTTNPNSELYIEHLVSSNQMSKEAVLALANFSLLNTSTDERCAEIKAVLLRVGG